MVVTCVPGATPIVTFPQVGESRGEMNLKTGKLRHNYTGHRAGVWGWQQPHGHQPPPPRGDAG